MTDVSDIDGILTYNNEMHEIASFKPIDIHVNPSKYMNTPVTVDLLILPVTKPCCELLYYLYSTQDSFIVEFDNLRVVDCRITALHIDQDEGLTDAVWICGIVKQYRGF